MNSPDKDQQGWKVKSNAGRVMSLHLPTRVFLVCGGSLYGVPLLEFFINVPVKLLELEALCYTRFMGFLRCFISSGQANPFLDETKGDSV